MTQDTVGAGIPEPGPDNFDFQAWLSDTASFPEFDHTVYVDQKSGAELARVIDQIEIVTLEAEHIAKQVEERRKAGSGSFVDPVLDDLLRQHEEAASEAQALIERKRELNANILASAVTLSFQARTPEELGTITREATRNFHRENQQFANASDDNLDYVTLRTRYTLTAQLAHFCTGMEVRGRKLPPPSQTDADALLRRLITSETMRLMEKIGTELSAARDWTDKIDAGFPGGGADLEDRVVDQAGAEGGPVVGGSPDGDADRRDVGLV